MHYSDEFTKRNYAGCLILFAILFGGTTKQGIWSDSLLYVLAIPAVIIGFSNFFENRLGVIARGFCVAIIAILAAQFLPVDIIKNLPEYQTSNDGSQFLTKVPSRSFNLIITSIVLLGFFLYLATLGEDSLQSLINFVFIGIALNVLITVIQLSFDTKIAISGLLPYTIRMGTFQNENHFSSLSYLVIPFLAWRFLLVRWNPVSYGIAGLVLAGLQFAVGSRAGMVLSTSLFMFCFIWAITYKKSLAVKVIACSVGVALVGYLFLTQDSSNLIDTSSRDYYFLKSWEIAKENWLTGTGLGSFFSIWPIFEDTASLGKVYITHVHNDYIELFLETGISFFILVAIFIALIARNGLTNEFTQAASISIVSIMIHSFVDFPLRTMAISMSFILSIAIILTNREQVGVREKKKNKTRSRRIAG